MEGNENLLSSSANMNKRDAYLERLDELKASINQLRSEREVDQKLLVDLSKELLEMQNMSTWSALKVLCWSASCGVRNLFQKLPRVEVPSVIFVGPRVSGGGLQSIASRCCGMNSKKVRKTKSENKRQGTSSVSGLSAKQLIRTTMVASNSPPSHVDMFT